MKRSEMLDLMQDKLDKLAGRRVSDSDVLDELLKTVEEAGMLPPMSKWLLNKEVNIKTYEWDENEA